MLGQFVKTKMAEVVDTKAAYEYDEGEEKAFVSHNIPVPIREVTDKRLKGWLAMENLSFLSQELYCFKYDDLYSITKEDFETLSKDLEAAQKIRFRQAIQAFQSHYSTKGQGVRGKVIKAQKYDDIFKVILIGDCNVGKSNILSRFTKDQFEPMYEETIGLKCEDQIVELPEKNIKLQIYDTSGSHDFGTISKVFFRETHGVIIIYDMTNADSFNNIELWIKKVEMQVAEKAWKILIGNKLDLENERVISKEQGQKLANQNGIKYMECSAKMGNNIDEMFSITAQYLLSIWDQQNTKETTNNGNGCSCILL